MLSCLHTLIQYTVPQPIQPNHMPAFLTYFFFLSLPTTFHSSYSYRWAAKKKQRLLCTWEFFTMPSPNDQAGRINRQAFMVELPLFRTCIHLGTSPYLLCARCQPLFSLPFAYWLRPHDSMFVYTSKNNSRSTMPFTLLLSAASYAQLSYCTPLPLTSSI